METLTKPLHNYTHHGWEGTDYRKNKNLSPKEIAKLFRKEIKDKLPNCKFSITVHNYNSICISLMAAPFKAISDGCDHVSVNHYYIKEDAKTTNDGKHAMQVAMDVINKYNFDDSDSQVDYFNTNFYLNLQIGKWDKPFIKL